jgi:hypothetical protein
MLQHGESLSILRQHELHALSLAVRFLSADFETVFFVSG